MHTDRYTPQRLLLNVALAFAIAACGLVLLALATACRPPMLLSPAPPNVLLIVAGDRRALETEAATVGDLLGEAAITLNALDRVQPPETAQIRDGMTITVTRIREEFETITATLPFERRVARDAALSEGETRLLQAGQPGIHERVYRLLFENGAEIERALVKDATAVPPQDEIIVIGTRPMITTINITGTLAYLEQQDAWVIHDSTARRRPLTAFGDLDGRVFTLSPAGTRLLFTRAVTDEGHINSLWMVDTQSVDAEPVALERYDVLWADWSHTGNSLAWTTAAPVDQPPGWQGRNDLWSAVLSSRDTLIGERQLLEPEAAGAYGWWGTRYLWSPVGEELAYARPDEVGVVDPQARERRPLFSFPPYQTYSSWAWEPGLAWSPEGDFLATVIHGPAPGAGDPEDSPVFDLWMLEATGAYSAALATEIGMWAAPQFGPDGRTLLYGHARIPYQSQLSDYTLCTIDRDGSNRNCLFPPEDEVGIELPIWRWSPDQAFVALIYRGDLHLLRLEDNIAIPVTDESNVTNLDWR